MNEITKELMEALKGCERIMSCFELDGFETKAARAAIAKAEAALAEPQADADGWIPWSGGECPTPEGMAFDLRFCNGTTLLAASSISPGDKWNWGRERGPYDIVAYRIAKESDK